MMGETYCQPWFTLRLHLKVASRERERSTFADIKIGAANAISTLTTNLAPDFLSRGAFDAGVGSINASAGSIVVRGAVNTGSGPITVSSGTDINKSGSPPHRNQSCRSAW